MPSSSFGERGDAESGLPTESGATSLRLPLARLLQLVLILQCEQFPNARMLAEACAVSKRTIYRDLANLEAAGLTVFYSPEKQGYALARECWIQPTQLTEREALALLVMSRLGAVPDPFGAVLPTGMAMAKVIQSLPDELRNRIARSGELLPETRPASNCSPERERIYETILSALAQRKRMRVWYREREQNPLPTTKLALYRLARIEGRWSLVGHSSAHRGVRALGLAAIERIELTDEPYVTPARFRLDRFLRKSNICNSYTQQDVQLRFTARVAPSVRDLPPGRAHCQVAESSGDLDVFLTVEGFDEIVFWVLGFGDQVEVIGPDELRIAVKEWAERIARRYSQHATTPTGGNGFAAPSQPAVVGSGQVHDGGCNGQPSSTDD